MIFDQYSRYKACSDLLRLAGFSPGNSVLDVGSGPECLFGQFMPDAAMTYIDPLMSENTGSNHIAGDVFDTRLDGRIFDCVSAVDVLEHVPPEHRQALLERLSSLGRNTLILGFPTSDSSSALETDKAIEDQYRAVFGRDYSWLEEHHRFGLPSLAETMQQLGDLGWHCQSVGHGHAPWLQELLGFVICAWDIPGLKDIVLKVSERFNRELYPHDFSPPHYRQFVIAARSPLSPAVMPAGTNNNIEMELAFRALMEDAHRQYFAASMRQLADTRDLPSRMEVAMAERDAATAERDAATAERDAAIEQLRLITNSRSWRLTRLLRFGARLLRYGFLQEDKRRLVQTLRSRYRRFPLPGPVRKLAGYVYHRIVMRAMRALRRRTSATARFSAPSSMSAIAASHLPDYFIWGVIDWHFRHQRPQQLALALAKTGRRIFYISPNFVDDERAGFEAEALDAVGLLWQIKLFVKNAPGIYSRAPGADAVARLRASLGELLDWADVKQNVSLIQHPFWHETASVLPAGRLVYDCMDHHEGFGNVSPEMIAMERALLASADLTITTSTWLDSLVADKTGNRVVIRNAGEFEHFSRIPGNIFCDPKGRRIIGYYGAIAEWFDIELVASIAQKFSDCCILLIGSDTVNARGALGKYPNVIFTGEIPYMELPRYLHAFDVCMLPFKVMPLTLATNPVKVYEYLSAGKPVVAVDLPEMSQFDGLVDVARNHDEYCAAIGRQLEQHEDPAAVAARREFGRNQTWDHRTALLIQHAESTANDPPVSVIVVTYNNLELTQACLASLDAHSHYDNIEIIVVDNASRDGSPDFLADWVKQAGSRKLVLNADNKGFAAANNQGLAMAGGDFLVLLNNDTYVTPGWVRTMVNHMRRNPCLGLLGPVTNNIGNEARIDISYETMDEMIVRSAAYTCRRAGRIFPLRTAAFFCVMIPRKTYETVGPLDEAFGRGFFEDDDYCRRVEQLGLQVACAEDVFIHHQLSASFGKLKQQDRQKLFEENRKIYEKKWGEWIPHNYRNPLHPVPPESSSPGVFQGQDFLTGQCNVCGKQGRFFYEKVDLWRESLDCEHCRTTSRYRSIARGLLRAINELTGMEAKSLAELSRSGSRKLHVYDTQPAFYYEQCAYPLPDLLKKTGWIDVAVSQYRPDMPMGAELAPGVSNQNLECLTFADESLDMVITSDVMGHVRLDDRAHQEIQRVLKPGGIYIFTVPHCRAWHETLIRVQVNDPVDATTDVHLLEPEYHGDTNSRDGGGVLSYRVYGMDMDKQLSDLGFDVLYTKEDFPEQGIMNTELFYCRKRKESL